MAMVAATEMAELLAKTKKVSFSGLTSHIHEKHSAKFQVSDSKEKLQTRNPCGEN